MRHLTSSFKATFLFSLVFILGVLFSFIGYLRKGVVPLQMRCSWVKMNLKSLELFDYFVASDTSCLPLSDRLDFVAFYVCVPLMQEGATNFGCAAFIA